MNIEYVQTEQALPLNHSLFSLAAFIYDNMGIYRDSKSAIIKALEYSLSNNHIKGGGILFAYNDNELIGAIVINQTGMGEYIPEYFFVYVVVDINFRSRGIGTMLLKKGIELCKGDIALHVEYDNPAKGLYEKLGFINKYAEMRREKEHHVEINS